jgi:cephalosporin-C deacetylase-like acetyl esterase
MSNESGDDSSLIAHCSLLVWRRSMTSSASETFTPSARTPDDLDAYWRAAMDELEALSAAAEVDPLPLRSTDFADCYAVKLTSVGPYRLYAYYSVPHGEGPFPVIYHAPAYASVVQVPPYEERRRHISLSLCARGQRLSDRPFAASYPGLLTHGIERPASYIYRGIGCDAVRGVDFLLSRPEVDARRIAVVGNDMALLAAALRPQVAAVVMAGPLFYAAADLAPATSAYPWEEINDYTRLNPDRAGEVFGTLGYFDPLHLAPRVRANVYLPHDRPGGFVTAERLAPLVAALPDGATLYELTGYGYTDRCAQEAWLAAQLGTDAD